MSKNNKKHRYASHYLSDVLQWDTFTWRKALYYWDSVLPNWVPRQQRALREQRAPRENSGREEQREQRAPQENSGREVQRETPQRQTLDGIQVLDIGARDGGLSLHFADKGAHVVCSDINGPSHQARELHQRYKVDNRIEYANVDATSIPFDDDSFDLVVFKSVLGAAAEFNGTSVVDEILGEVYRVLKPGGLLLFAENLEGSRFHQWARPRFKPWGLTYYYIPLPEINRLLSRFDTYRFYTYGFFSCVKKDFLPLAILDRAVCLSKCSASHYMVYGHAIK